MTEQTHPRQRVLLLLLPYWTPSIPPLGISCLKSHLNKHGFDVTTVDANMELRFRTIYDSYFALTAEYVPQYKHGNFFNIGMDLMRNHLQAEMYYTDMEEYIKLVEVIFERTFFCTINRDQIIALNELMKLFYIELTEYMLELLHKHKPEVLGISVFSGTLPASQFAFRVAKEYDQNIMTVMGGGTFSMELALGTPNFDKFLATSPFIDKFIVGEGENLFLRLLQGRLKQDQRVFTLADIPNDNVDINEVELPDFSDFNLKVYPQIGAWSSRSCPYQCSFCSETVHWGNYRKKKPVPLVKELVKMYERYGIQIFMMGDSLLNIVVDGMAEEFMKEKVAIYWDGYLRADPPVCIPENTMKWRRGGLYRARLGVESGSQKILDIMNKKMTVDSIRQAVSSLAAAGIKTTTYWIVGHPGETEEDFIKTLNLIEELKDDLWEAEVNAFSYYLTGQVHSEKWMSEYEKETLFPKESTEMLITQTWTLKDCAPSRLETYDRVNRFVAHCNKLGIPNPYFEHEVYQADMRWKKLHRNAVPALVEFKNANSYINECKFITDLKHVKANTEEAGDFSF